MVTIPPLVVRIRASSTVLVKASSLVNLDLGGIFVVVREWRKVKLVLQVYQRGSRSATGPRDGGGLIQSAGLNEKKKQVNWRPETEFTSA